MKNNKRTSPKIPESLGNSSPVKVMAQKDAPAAQGSFETDLVYSLELASALEITSHGIKELTSPLSD